MSAADRELLAATLRNAAAAYERGDDAKGRDLLEEVDGLLERMAAVEARQDVSEARQDATDERLARGWRFKIGRGADTFIDEIIAKPIP